VLPLHEVDDIGPAGFEDGRQRAGVQAAGLHRKRRQGSDVPVDPEVVGRDPRGDRRDRQARRDPLVTASVDANAAAFEVRGDHLAERVTSEPRLQRHGNAEACQAERDVGWAAARMRGQGPPSTLPDEVDERLADDNEHPVHPST
jgi:hypothetical protein